MSPTNAALSAPSAVAEHEFPVVVAAVEEVAEGVIALTLVSPDGSPLTHWTPGAHVDVLIGPELTRQYSLCGDPADRSRWRIGVLREQQSRGGSAWLHEHVAVGDRLTVAGPRNHFELTPAPDYLFIAGGIGITPLLPMIAAAAAGGAAWELHYVGRSWATMAFLDELAEPPTYVGHVHLAPRDRAPRPDLSALLATPRPGRAVYACGPDALLDAIEAAMTAANWAPGALHVERFTPREVDHSGDEPFEVELATSGQRLWVAAEQSVFAALREGGVSILGSCLEGTCGTCETEILDVIGEIVHRDTVLTAAERETNETMMVCVSRCRAPGGAPGSGRIVLDL